MPQYNGWTNYETWLTYLWLSNDQSTDTYCHELVTGTDSPIRAEKVLKEFVEEGSPLFGQANLYVDLLTAAMAKIDWQELVTRFAE
jgi:hypothetical protein